MQYVQYMQYQAVTWHLPTAVGLYDLAAADTDRMERIEGIQKKLWNVCAFVLYV